MLFSPYLLALSAALAIRDEPKPVKFGLSKGTRQEPITSERSFRAAPGAQEANLWVDGFFYLIDVDIGNQGQKVSVEIDTGSADLWVDKRILNDVSTWKNLSEPYSVWYYDHTLVQGWYGTSPIWLDNGLKIDDFQWALATIVTHNAGTFHGIFGVGRVENEDAKNRYPNLVQKLKDDGIIKTNGYLYYLNSKDATSGSIVFGGIDKAKIKGDVATVPLTTGTANSRFDNLHISKITGVDGEVLGENIESFLDTGLTISKLPPNIVDQIRAKVPNAVRDGSITWVPCELDPNLYILFWFNDVEIKLSLNDLAIKSYNNDGKPNGKCVLGVQPTLDGVPVHLGVSTLTHAYVTINHDENVALISNVNYTDEEDIVLL